LADAARGARAGATPAREGNYELSALAECDKHGRHAAPHHHQQSRAQNRASQKVKSRRMMKFLFPLYGAVALVF